MLKNKWKTVVLVTILSFMLVFHFNIAFATDTTATENGTTTNEAVNSEEDLSAISDDSDEDISDDSITSDGSDATTDQEIYEDDLYLFDTDVVMDKLVDGNVYIFAETAEITGQVNGNLYVCANNVTFSGSYIRYSIYACANTIEFDAACNDLYAVCNSLNVTYDSYIVRDVRALSDSMSFIGAVGRNAHLTANSLSFGEETTEEGETSKLALIYGDLNYTTPSEISIPEGVVEGEANHIEMSGTTEKSVSSIVYDYIISLAECLVFTFVVFFLMLWLTPKFAEKSSEFVSSKMGIGLGIGIISIIAAIIIFFLLAFSVIGMSVAIAFITAYILLASIGFAVVSICFANKFAKDGKLGKKLGMLAIVTIILWALTKIPYIGGVIWFVVTFAGLGSLLYYSFTKNKDVKKVAEKVAE